MEINEPNNALDSLTLFLSFFQLFPLTVTASLTQDFGWLFGVASDWFGWVGG